MDITPVRSVGNRLLTGAFNIGFRTRFSDLCYGFNAFWADLLPVLDLPDHARPSNEGARMQWGDGFEIETVINCRFAAAGVDIVEVPSMEQHRVFGESNLNAFTDGLRVLRTLFTEWRRVSGGTWLAVVRPSRRRRRELPVAIERARPGNAAA